MSVEDDLLKIKEIKKSLNTAIRAKGSDIADATRFDQYPKKIEDLGGNSIEIYTTDTNGKLQFAKDIVVPGVKTLSWSGDFGKMLSTETISFPDLEQIETNNEIRFIATKAISLPKLVSVTGTSFLIFSPSRYMDLVDTPVNFYLPNLKTIEYGSYMFIYNKSTISLPNLEEVTKGTDSMFAYCQGDTIELPKLRTVRRMSSMFKNASKLKTISFPSLIVGDALDYFGPKTADEGYSTFDGCNALSEIHFRADQKEKIIAKDAYGRNLGAPNATIYFDL